MHIKSTNDIDFVALTYDKGKGDVKDAKLSLNETRMEFYGEMRIEMRLRCYLVIWSLVICN